ncbi:transposase [Verminephrobacter aporrectodeae]|uniref:transposase n=1 Tax=Verminephrobacter aporrectodeae TaxID=1110389 RepID=UPI001F3A54F2|nr:transposase [Verminephrobacter aporrectodeae]
MSVEMEALFTNARRCCINPEPHSMLMFVRTTAMQALMSVATRTGYIPDLLPGNMRRDISQRAEPKVTYRVKNWAQYNAGLIARGDIEVWIDKNLLRPAPTADVSRRGRPIVYPDAVIQGLLSLKQVFDLPLRALQGFVQSLRRLAFPNLPVPSYTTLSRRAQRLMTHQEMGDSEALTDLLEQIPCATPIDIVGGDGAYDTKACHAQIAARGATPSIPRAKAPCPGGRPRRAQLGAMRPLTRSQRAGRASKRREWKKASGYHKRSLVENLIYRLKTLTSHFLWARTVGSQATEVAIRAGVLNRMASLARPPSARLT